VAIILVFTILHFHRHSLSFSASGFRKYPLEVQKKKTAETFPFKCLAVRVTKAYEYAYTIHQLLNTQEMIQRHDK
jgi:hypothetical protein